MWLVYKRRKKKSFGTNFFLTVKHETFSITKVGGNDDSNNQNQPNEESDGESDRESDEESDSHVDPFFAMAAEAIDNNLEDNVIMPPNVINQQCEL